MATLTEFFCTPARESRSAWSVINWWESRRVVYNLSVGAAGLVSVMAIMLSTVLPPHAQRLTFAWQPIVVYAVLANLCYSLGPAIDLFVRRRWGERYAPVGPALFRYGFAFSMGLTLLPIPLAVVSWVARVISVLA